MQLLFIGSCIFILSTRVKLIRFGLGIRNVIISIKSVVLEKCGTFFL